MKKILLITALFAGLAGSGFAMSEEDSNNSLNSANFVERSNNYEQILLAGIDDIGARRGRWTKKDRVAVLKRSNKLNIGAWRGKWTEEQKIAAIDNLNKFENNETQASGHEITPSMEIRLGKLLPNTWDCIIDCCKKAEVELVEENGIVKYKYVKSKFGNGEQKKMSDLVKTVIVYNECVRSCYWATLKKGAMIGPEFDWKAHIDKGLREGVLKKQTLGTETPDREYGWTVRFVKIPDFK